MQKIEPELLESLHHGNDYTECQLADIFGCSRGAIQNRMKKYGIAPRSVGSIVTDFTFNDMQKDIFDGLMLGDGGLIWETNYCCFHNTDIHEEYLIWLQKQLGVEDISRITPRYYFVGAGAPFEYQLATRVIPSIKEQHIRWYPYETRRGTNQNRQPKIIPKDIELTPIKMLFWYIGDGTYRKRNKDVWFNNCLVLEDWMILSRKISKVLDVDSGISICKHRKDEDGIQRYYLRLNKSVTRKFFDMVDSLGFDVPDCYQYKFGG